MAEILIPGAQTLKTYEKALKEKREAAAGT